jgi:hypothetical protein
MSELTFYCYCKDKCKSSLRKLGKMAYYAHRKHQYHDKENQKPASFTPDMQQFMNENLVIIHPTPSNATESSRGSQNKQLCLSEAEEILDNVIIDLISHRSTRGR